MYLILNLLGYAAQALLYGTRPRVVFDDIYTPLVKRFRRRLRRPPCRRKDVPRQLVYVDCRADAPGHGGLRLPHPLINLFAGSNAGGDAAHAGG